MDLTTANIAAKEGQGCRKRPDRLTALQIMPNTKQTGATTAPAVCTCLCWLYVLSSSVPLQLYRAHSRTISMHSRCRPDPRSLTGTVTGMGPASWMVVLLMMVTLLGP